MKPLEVFFLDSIDPYLNLQIEDSLLRAHTGVTKTLILWINGPCIVMGRFQNPWKEIKVQKAVDDNIQIIRRQSGGGCVYHDQGNLNFSFIGAKDSASIEDNLKIIIKALATFDVKAYTTNRHDLRVMSEQQDYKISGCAFKQTRSAHLHHGTLLVDVDLLKLNDYLRPKDIDISTKAISSVRSQVINLSKLNRNLKMDKLKDAIKFEFESFYASSASIGTFDHCFVEEEATQLRSWAKVFGETPKFEWSFSFEDIELSMLIKKATIVDVEISCVGIHPDQFTVLKSDLISQKFESRKIKNILVRFFVDLVDISSDFEKMISLDFE
jgi:lipoate---protein ligase